MGEGAPEGVAALGGSGASNAPGPVVGERLDGLGADGTRVRLGVMGGTFDPVHTGHLACAEMAADACGLDAVAFMVAPNPSLKRHQATAPAEDRLAMVRLAVADNPRFDASALEMARPGVTYTADTLRTLRGHYPENVELFFIVGADSLATLPRWHDAEALKDLATFVCVSRPGRFDADELLEGCRRAGFSIESVTAPLLDISSSELRRRVGKGEAIRYLAPLAVCAYVDAHGLYREGGLHG